MYRLYITTHGLRYVLRFQPLNHELLPFAIGPLDGPAAHEHLYHAQNEKSWFPADQTTLALLGRISLDAHRSRAR